MNTLVKNLNDSISAKYSILQNPLILKTIQDLTLTIVHAYKNGNKVLFCGNGGSAADAQHLAAELSGRYYYDRPPLFAEALHVNTSYLTAVANDYSYDEVFSRLVKAMGKKGDVLIGLSTSGNSSNVLKALVEARSMGMITAAFTGLGGGKMKDACDYWIGVPSDNTPRIQECHMIIGHSICEEVEKQLFPRT
jgi:D-sedoheptulose 7-phosphate isomerase